MHLIIINLVLCLAYAYASNKTANAPWLAPLYGKLDPEIGNRFAVVFKQPVSTSFVKRFVDQVGINQQPIKDPACETIIFLNVDTHVVDRIRSHPAVEYVEYVGKVKAIEDTCSLSLFVTWGVARVSQKKFTDIKHYNVQPGAGKGVRVYVLDSGINVNHVIFGGRAKWAKNYVPNSPDKDEQGHGTGVGGLVADVSKESTIYSVKVLNKDCAGRTDWTIEGICWVANEAMKTKDKIVMNLSLGTYNPAYVKAQNRAVTFARNAGVGVVAAAGNDARDACTFSPASSTDAITVASSNMNDKLSDFSNYGRCVDIIAPGEDLYIADAFNLTDFIVESGTSLSSPIVAGILANVLTIYDIKKGADGYDKVKELALKGYIRGLPLYTPNLLANNGCG